MLTLSARIRRSSAYPNTDMFAGPIVCQLLILRDEISSSNTILNNKDARGPPCFISLLRCMLAISSPSQYMVVDAPSKLVIIYCEVSSSTLNLLNAYLIEWCEILSKVRFRSNVRMVNAFPSD